MTRKFKDIPPGTAILPLSSPRRSTFSLQSPLSVSAATVPAGSISQVNHYAKDNVFRRLSFYLALALVFLRFSYLHEWVTMSTGIDTHLALILLPPTVLSVLLSGGLRQSFRGRPTYYWFALAGWLLLASATSVWRSGSLGIVSSYLKTDFPFLLVIAGAVSSWRDCRLMMYVIGWSAVVNAIAGRRFGTMATGRLNLTSGTMGNANDLAAQLLILLPFLLFVCVTSKSLLIKAASLGSFLYVLYLAFATGSRGAFIGIMVSAAVVFLRASAKVRLIFVIVVPLAVSVMLVSLPRQIIHRFATTFSNEADITEAEDEGAAASREVRIALLKASSRLTLEHPLFGVGPGEFADVMTGKAAAKGLREASQVAHNSYTQLSSEAGIPALIFLIAAMVSTYRLLNKTEKLAKTSPAHREMGIAASYVIIALVAFSTCIFFLSLIYRFYLPALSGIAIALAEAARREITTPKPV